MILLIDNYDSLVFNLARFVEELGIETQVVRNDEISLDDVRSLSPDAIILSPGPCTPNETGICLDVVRQLGTEYAILGVCLGHQTIAAAFDADVVRAPKPVHGRTSLVTHDEVRLFEGVPNPIRATRYHSLIVDEASMPNELMVTARTEDSLVMAFEHRTYRVFGVQFHPESVLTECGHRMLGNFLRLAGLQVDDHETGDALGEAVIGPTLAAELESVRHSWTQDTHVDPPLHW